MHLIARIWAHRFMSVALSGLLKA